MDFVLECIDIGLPLPPLPPLPPLLLFEEAGETRIVEATVSQSTLEGSSFVLTFLETLWTLLVIYHGRFGRFETHIIELFFFRAQRRTVLHNVSVVTMSFIHISFVTTTYQNPYGASWSTQWWYLHFLTKNINNCSMSNIEDWTNFLFCIDRCVPRPTHCSCYYMCAKSWFKKHSNFIIPCPSLSFSQGHVPPDCIPPVIRCKSQFFSVSRGLLFFLILDDASVNNLNLSVGSPRSTISNCVKAILAIRASLGTDHRDIGFCLIWSVDSDLLLCSCWQWPA